MKVAETIVQNLSTYLTNKKILEIACGECDFSVNASRYAEKVLATDISLERLKRRNLEYIPNNIEFNEMDATKLDIDNDTFDVAICYNALGHLENILSNVLGEMNRVTIDNGYLIFVATWKMDKRILQELKDIIRQYNNLIIYEDVENKQYNTLIIKKEQA